MTKPTTRKQFAVGEKYNTDLGSVITIIAIHPQKIHGHDVVEVQNAEGKKAECLLSYCTGKKRGDEEFILANFGDEFTHTRDKHLVYAGDIASNV